MPASPKHARRPQGPKLDICFLAGFCIIIVATFIILIPVMWSLSNTDMRKNTSNIHQSMPANASVVFIHIPRAGGSSVLPYWKKNMEILGCSPINLAHRIDDLMDGINGRGGDCVMVYGAEAARKLPKITVGGNFTVKSVFGQIPFGVCDFLPEPCVYATVVRHPVDRLMSHYYHYKASNPGSIPCPYCDTFEDFVDALEDEKLTQVPNKIPFWYDNLQTRLVLGDGFKLDVLGLDLCGKSLQGCDRHRFKEFTSSEVVRAKQNLENEFSAVGVLESLDGFIVQMKKMHGFEYGDVDRVDQRYRGTRDLPRKVYEKIVRLEKWDMMLYTFAKMLDDKRKHK